jgi:hypothetical protein
MAESKRKGNLAEVEVIRHALRQGYRVAIPLGEDAPYDLVVDRSGSLERVQCKYVKSDGRSVTVRCRSTNGWATHKYTADEIDWIATFDATTDRCYFVPASMLYEGRAALTLRLAPALNGQSALTRSASDFLMW